MTLALASIFNWKHSKNFVFVTLFAQMSTTSCVSRPPQNIDAANADGSNPPARKILPPPLNPDEQKSKKSQSQMEKLLATLPNESKDQDSEVSLPVSIFDGIPSQQVIDEQTQRRRDMRNRRTDNEITGQSRNIEERRASELGQLDKDLQVTSEEKPGMAPSYVTTLQRIKDLYKQREFENALVETNEALRFYPHSAQLLTMKGTLYQRINQLELALASYEHAYDLEPSRKLLAQMDHLRTILSDRSSIARSRNTLVAPGDSPKIENSEKGVP